MVKMRIGKRVSPFLPCLVILLLNARARLNLLFATLYCRFFLLCFHSSKRAHLILCSLPILPMEILLLYGEVKEANGRASKNAGYCQFSYSLLIVSPFVCWQCTPAPAVAVAEVSSNTHAVTQNDSHAYIHSHVDNV